MATPRRGRPRAFRRGRRQSHRWSSQREARRGRRASRHGRRCRAGLALGYATAILNTLGLALLVSTVVRTQQQAMMTAAFVFMVPMIYLSGLVFPIENMPRGIQLFTYAIPLRYYANA